jgi:hypothetical protein
MSSSDFTELLDEATAHYETGDSERILHLERACREVLEPHLNDQFGYNNLALLLADMFSHFEESDVPAVEAGKQLLLPALILAAKCQMGEQRVQELLQRRYQDDAVKRCIATYAE